MKLRPLSFLVLAVLGSAAVAGPASAAPPYAMRLVEWWPERGTAWIAFVDRAGKRVAVDGGEVLVWAVDDSGPIDEAYGKCDAMKEVGRDAVRLTAKRRMKSGAYRVPTTRIDPASTERLLLVVSTRSRGKARVPKSLICHMHKGKAKDPLDWPPG